MHELLPLIALSWAQSASARSLWSSKPASNFSDIIRTAYPIGNGRLAALPFGTPGHEKLSLNLDSLWSGGPFENASYTGGNPSEPKYGALEGIRDWIWKNGTGNVTALMGDASNYGSYSVLGNLSVTLSEVNDYDRYKRTLDLETGVHETTFRSGEAEYTISAYCSSPDDVCVYDVQSSKALPMIKVSFENVQTNATLISATCSDRQARLTGTTKAGIGMTYDALAQVIGKTGSTSCADGTLTVSPAQKQHRFTLVISAGTDYDETHGTAEYDYSFRGADPETYVEDTAHLASLKSTQELLECHLEDFASLSSAFMLDLTDPRGSAGIETSEIISRYTANDTAGDPFLEALAFDFGRYLFISSSRDNALPPNLQGKWAYSLENDWGADYHANINLQMNHWPADQTGLGDLQTALWDYMAETWAPRGAETARLLYNASGWVTHNEMNIFGYTAMKTGDAIWANYPASAAWMMQHVWDYYDYSRNSTWLATTGYPLLKGIASFWLSQLQEDQHFHDGTLVVNPCDSPEHGSTTFGCTHYQQLIHQVFETTLQASTIVSDPDDPFLTSLTASLQNLDKGLHIGSWNQIQEWKLDLDTQNNTHRHLSQLIGWFPGFALSSYQSGYTNSSIQSAIATTLTSRGPGIADANAGWEKVWRAACWARLNNTELAHYELRLTLQENWAGNGLSMYDGTDEPFQIDANFGFVGAVLAMLVVDLPGVGDFAVEERTVVLGPAIPRSWGGGSVRGLRLRGGGSVDFGWDTEGLVDRAELQGARGITVVNKEGDLLARC